MGHDEIWTFRIVKSDAGGRLGHSFTFVPGLLRFQAREVFAKRLSEVRIPERQFDISLEIAQWITSIVVLALEAKSKNRIFLAKNIQSIGELNLTACVGTSPFDGVPNDRFQDIATEDS